MRGVPNKRGPGRPKKIRYKRLRTRMETMDVSSADIAQVIGLEASGVRRRLAGQTPWALWEAYKVLELLGIPETEVYLYFPASGEDVESREERRLRSYLAETNQSLVADSTLDALVALVEGMQAARAPGRQV